MLHPRGQLADLEGAKGGVVVNEYLQASGRQMHMGVSFYDAGRYQINQYLTPFDIEAGEDGQVIQQGLGYRLSEEGEGKKQGLLGNARPSKNNQVALRCLLSSRHPNTGVGGGGSKIMVHCLDKCWHYHRICM